MITDYRKGQIVALISAADGAEFLANTMEMSDEARHVALILRDSYSAAANLIEIGLADAAGA